MQSRRHAGEHARRVVDASADACYFPPHFCGGAPKEEGSEVTDARLADRGGTLFLVATPIGNLDDITSRALQTLKGVALVAAEDTRHTRRLLDHFGIRATLVSLHDHNERQRLPAILARLEAGESVAVVTDAGSPGIADPGYPLVRAAIEAGHRVESIPGPSAVVAALQVSGLPTDAFTFLGFLPPRSAARRKLFEEHADRRETLVVFESPHRIESCLEDIEAVWGERTIALARELTKIHEQVLRGSAREVRAALRPDQTRGEMVLVLSGRSRADARRAARDARDARQRGQG